jgi:lipoate-protein ligase A
MPNLAAALNADPLKFRDKAVKSVRSRVTNISEHLREPMDVMQFAELIQDHIAEKYPDAQMLDLGSDDHDRIHELVRNKYNTWEWNFGYSPNYNFKKIVRTDNSGTIEFDLDVHGGNIMHAKIFGDYFSMYDTEEIEIALTGAGHNEPAIRKALEPYRIGDYFQNLSLDEFLTGLF